MNKNSLEVWYDKVKPTLTERQAEVLQMLTVEPMCCREVAIAMGTFPNNISGRFKELADKGLIVELNQKKIGRSLHTVWHPLVQQQLTLI